MENKRFIKVFFGISGGLLLLAAAIVGLIDPFGFYHKPLFGMEAVGLNQSYQNPGYVKNYEYETAIVGSSMAEGMRASEADRIFDTTTIKVCLSGAHSMDLASMLQLVCEEGKAKRIITSFDANMFRKEYDTYRGDMPEYLYNDNPFDDIEYLLNGEVFFKNVPEVLEANKTGDIRKMDDYYIEDASCYSKETALYSYTRGKLGEESITWNRVDKNIANIRSVIEENTDVTFYIYMPPYSILFWERYASNGMVKQELEMHKKIVEAFIPLENVKFYYLMNDYETITNLDNYKDAGHYSPTVSSEILQKLHDGVSVVTKDNYESVFEEMENFANNYDYETIFTDDQKE